MSLVAPIDSTEPSVGMDRMNRNLLTFSLDERYDPVANSSWPRTRTGGTGTNLETVIETVVARFGFKVSLLQLDLDRTE